MRVRLGLCLVSLSLLAATASAQTPDWSQATSVEVDLSNFKFEPDTLSLKAGQPYVLHLVNKAGSGHDFEAKAFFAAAMVSPDDKAAVGDGSIELAGNGSRDIHFVAPAAGDYEIHCTHFMHASFGMKGRITVQ